MKYEQLLTHVVDLRSFLEASLSDSGRKKKTKIVNHAGGAAHTTITIQLTNRQNYLVGIKVDCPANLETISLNDL